jgi:hypothetical protein
MDGTFYEPLTGIAVRLCSHFIPSWDEATGNWNLKVVTHDTTRTSACEVPKDQDPFHASL